MRARLHKPRTILGWFLVAFLLLALLAFASGLLEPFWHAASDSLGLVSTATPTSSQTNTPEPTATTAPPVISVIASPTRRGAVFPTATPRPELPTIVDEPEILPTPEPPTATPTSPPPPTLAAVQPALPDLPAPPPATLTTPATAVIQSQPTSTPLPALPTGSPTPIPTASPTFPPPAPAPPPSFNACQADTDPYAAPNYPVRILGVDKETEVFVLQNVSPEPVALKGWRMCSVNGSQQFSRLLITLQPGETRMLVFPGAAVWNNNERDDGALYNQNGQLISYWFNF